MPLHFCIEKFCSESKARVGVLKTQHGVIETPVFMPVGTRGAVKAVTTCQLQKLDVPIILGNTYHLMLRPGMQIMERAGGLHAFMQWPNSLLTDSGGFQVFSLASLSRITDQGVQFRSHIDGAAHFLGPMESMQIQKTIGADIVMAFDQCCPYPCERAGVEQAVERTASWAEVCRSFDLQGYQSLFGIVQGGMHSDLRHQSAESLMAMDFDGYAVGGLSVGEPEEMMYDVLDEVVPRLPLLKPRYLMGVGTPRNLLEAVMRGIDMFDCVLPTRNARNGTAFTWAGKINIKAGRYADDFSPLDPQLDNAASQSSKAYVRHLLNVGEIAGLTLVTQHNIAFYLDFMRQLRHAISCEALPSFCQKIDALYPKNRNS